MRRSVSALAYSAAELGTLGEVMTSFVPRSKPWDEYISQLSRQDDTPYHAPLNPKPMYRGRNQGMEGWLFREQTQLHYQRYPDEHVVTNLHRWQYGETVGDVGLQQFRGAQPPVLDVEDEQGLQFPNAGTYMKLNYKNPLTFSRFLTRTGHYYTHDVMPMNPEAVRLLRTAVAKARRLGFYPKVGNPYWHRSQKDRPQLLDSEYSPERAKVRQTMQHFTYNWLQTQRIKNHFDQIEKARASARGESKTHLKVDPGYDRPSRKSREPNMDYTEANVPYSVKKPTVDGMSTSGYRSNRRMVVKEKQRRMGFGNPAGFMRR